MRRLLIIIIIICLGLNKSAIVTIAADSGTKADDLQVTGRSSILMDLESGQILFERNSHERLAIASITKIMTAMVAMDRGNLDSVITVGPEVLDRKKIYGTLIFLAPGEEFTLQQLLAAMLMNSANDAAVAIAKSIGGSEEAFIQMMNQKAEDLGLKDTHFINPHGLSEIGHYSSAYDMAIITRSALENSALAAIVKTKEADFPRTQQGMVPNHLQNRNKLLWQYEGADGVKTGYTDLAGNTIVASATRNDRQLLAVILKGTSLLDSYNDASVLLDYGFNHFNNKLIVSRSQTITSVKLKYGLTVELGPAKDIYVTVASNQKVPDYQIKAVPVPVELPVNAGDQLGWADVFLAGNYIQTVPLVAENGLVLPVADYLKYFLLGGLMVSGLVVFPRVRRYYSLRRRRRRVIDRGLD
jgi:D-alanyl-D-alanine carboxypeptidase (penicillin-binding protein 5/6)